MSDTEGMNIAQRIMHVGGRSNAAGYVEFGSTQAVEALVRQVIRDLPACAPQAWTPIESAPKYGDDIDIWSNGRRFTDCAFGKPTYGKELGWIYESYHDSDGPVYELVKNPTHWMPLPDAPA